MSVTAIDEAKIGNEEIHEHLRCQYDIALRALYAICRVAFGDRAEYMATNAIRMARNSE